MIGGPVFATVDPLSSEAKLFVVLFANLSFEIAMAFDDANQIQLFVVDGVEDQIIADREASDIGAQFWTSATHEGLIDQGG